MLNGILGRGVRSMCGARDKSIGNKSILARSIFCAVFLVEVDDRRCGVGSGENRFTYARTILIEVTEVPRPCTALVNARNNNIYIYILK